MEMNLDTLLFWSKVDLAGDGCWEWLAGRTGSGYGAFWVGDHNEGAHRVSHLLAKGPIPEGMQIDHLCHNRKCVNPAHLEVVTPAVNQHRSTSVSGLNKAKTHCHRGHPFDGENTQSVPGGRMCKQCARQATREWRARKKVGVA